MCVVEQALRRSGARQSKAQRQTQASRQSKARTRHDHSTKNTTRLGFAFHASAFVSPERWLIEGKVPVRHRRCVLLFVALVHLFGSVGALAWLATAPAMGPTARPPHAHKPTTPTLHRPEALLILSKRTVYFFPLNGPRRVQGGIFLWCGAVRAAVASGFWLALGEVTADFDPSLDFVPSSLDLHLPPIPPPPPPSL